MILYICPGQGRQKHTANHQRAKHVIWIVCLLCSVVHPKALCAWIWLVEGTKEAVCSPLTSVLLFAAALWCIEKLWLGYPSQTNAREIPLLCIILNNSLTIHCKAFIPFKTFILNFVPTVCLSTVMGNLVWLYCTEEGGWFDGELGACSSDMKQHHLTMWHCLSRELGVYNILTPFRQERSVKNMKIYDHNSWQKPSSMSFFLTEQFKGIARHVEIYANLLSCQELDWDRYHSHISAVNMKLTPAAG